MKTTILFSLYLLLATTLYAAPWDQGQEWLEVSKEYKDEILEKLEASKQLTKKQLETIDGCLNQPEMKEVLSCFSSGGVAETAGVLTMIKNELSRIKQRICGKDFWGDQDKCRKFGESLEKMKNDLQKSWVTLVNRGKSYLGQSNKLLSMKRKICKEINQEGCYRWLNERIDLKCSPKKIGNDPAKIEECQLEVTQEVWDRVGS